LGFLGNPEPKKSQLPAGGRNHLPAFACQNRPARGHWKPPPGRAMACRQWGGACHCFVMFFFVKFVEHFELYFFSVEWTLMGFGEE